MIIEKVEGGYIVQHDGRKIIANAEHVANFIMRFMKDVAQHIENDVRSRLSIEPSDKQQDT